MRLEGRIWKARDGKWWLAELRDLDLVTQGTSRKDAAAMLADAVECLVNSARFRADVRVGKGGSCSVGSNDDMRLAALMVRRLRARAARSRSSRRRAA
ncbi:MAG TPA: hypothetical protein VKQ32_20630 [Polyangia bacterium]|nr:hypothetical protein [Polyangia bacterium]